MPTIKEVGFYDGKVKTVEVLDYFQKKDGTRVETSGPYLKVQMETEAGEHGYPTLYLTNEAGGRNTENLDWIKEKFGWDIDLHDPEELPRMMQGKTARFRCAQKGEYTNFYFVTREKDKAAPKDQSGGMAKLRALKLGGAVDVSLAVPASAMPDLPF